jgi:hypothetical protein
VQPQVFHPQGHQGTTVKISPRHHCQNIKLISTAPLTSLAPQPHVFHPQCHQGTTVKISPRHHCQNIKLISTAPLTSFSFSTAPLSKYLFPDFFISLSSLRAYLFHSQGHHGSALHPRHRTAPSSAGSSTASRLDDSAAPQGTMAAQFLKAAVTRATPRCGSVVALHGTTAARPDDSATSQGTMTTPLLKGRRLLQGSGNQAELHQGNDGAI